MFPIQLDKPYVKVLGYLSSLVTRPTSSRTNVLVPQFGLSASDHHYLPLTALYFALMGDLT